MRYSIDFVKDSSKSASTTGTELSFAHAPFYHEPSNSLCLLVERGPDNNELSEIRFIITSSGKSETFFRKDRTPIDNERIFYSVLLETIPESVKLSGAISDGPDEMLLGVLDQEDVVISDNNCFGAIPIAKLEDLPPAPDEVPEE